MSEIWKVQVYENGVWRDYGQPSKDFKFLYEMCKKMCENGRKARVIRAEAV